jgi:putative membrane protein
MIMSRLGTAAWGRYGLGKPIHIAAPCLRRLHSWRHCGIIMSTAAAWFHQKLRPARDERFAYALLAGWILSMVLLPIARWVYGDDAIPYGVALSTTLQAGTVLALLSGSWGTSRIVRMVLIVIVAAWAVEFVGSQTGFPFGVYNYTDRLQPQLGDVPLLIPFAWLMMLPPAWAVASLITGGARDWRFVVASALAFTAWDLFLDPQMVAWDFWRWADPVGYFGIPWSNYAGWLLASALLTLLARPGNLPVRPLLGIYAITWALETIGQLFFWELPGPAIVGFAAMGIMLALAVRGGREALR